jgi:hypothetical protein
VASALSTDNTYFHSSTIKIKITSVDRVSRRAKGAFAEFCICPTTLAYRERVVETLGVACPSKLAGTRNSRSSTVTEAARPQLQLLLKPVV